MNKESYFYRKGTNELTSVKNLIQKYGGDMTLSEIEHKINSEFITKYPYVCPKCKGKGYLVTEYNSYPPNLPDSGWVYEPGYDYKDCNLCHGRGRTDIQYEAIVETKVKGYKKVN